GGAGVLRLRGETAQLKWFVGDERLHRRETGVGQPQLARGLFPRGAETVVSDQSQTVTLDQVEPDGVEGALVDQRAHHLGGSATGVGRLGEFLAPAGEPLGQQQVAAVVVATLLLSGGELGDPAAEAVTGAAHRDHEPRGPGVVAEFLAQACDADTQRVEAIVRTGPTPYPGDQPTARHDLAVGLHQTDQQAEFGAGEGERFRVEGGLALPQVDPQWTGDQVTGAGVGSRGDSTHQCQHAGHRSRAQRQHHRPRRVHGTGASRGLTVDTRFCSRRIRCREQDLAVPSSTITSEGWALRTSPSTDLSPRVVSATVFDIDVRDRAVTDVVSASSPQENTTVLSPLSSTLRSQCQRTARYSASASASRPAISNARGS